MFVTVEQVRFQCWKKVSELSAIFANQSFCGTVPSDSPLRLRDDGYRGCNPIN